ncbi:MAG: DNA repair protein RecN [Azospira oryzae]|uniref:DNA repair protein RecN n=1 Tax=Pelomicrobium methylotrophicum TaxID=2602750 RepID=A0A5C7EJZ7_9PROT|nr:DNA repair protein RecN [Pelomicrobium methylotrophicum]PZP61127.1 MAG: DNA repair protein RecN [Azospira oryzae]PZP80915.1 MAG: DNA repair protein RecN [Azospira oryzae]TXF11333.1 DNA repair protein RecN [Pelomicrobium methylotrophicum]
MLRYLRIRDFVIVDEAELQFAGGFTALTGETGAGKSILIDALALVLGERADAGVVRAGAARAEVAAEFDVSRLPQVEAWLAESGFEGDPGICLLRRVVEAGGRSRAFVNGALATVQQLKAVGELLVDIHGQHAHQSLLRGGYQREVLDALGGQTGLAQEVAAAYRQWQALRAQRLEWQRNEQALARERDQLERDVKELEALAFSPDEWRQLQAEHGRLAHAAALLEGAQAALEALEGADAAVLGQVRAVIQRLSSLAGYDSRLQEVLELLEPAEIQLKEAVYSLHRYASKLDLDPARLNEVEQRLAAIHACARRHRVMAEELPQLLAQARARLEEIGGGEGLMALIAREEAAREAYLERARRLSEGRRQAARELSEAVTRALKDLAMGSGRFIVALHPVDPGGSFGLEQVEFQVATHPGTAPRPLGRIASGGELSRISLAIQVITSRVASVPTLIFDEVDAGIGGQVAEIVGRLLKQLGTLHQVMCVTHLPQVAAAADHQWQVSKVVLDGTVVSRIRPLTAEERVEEIARMVGGRKITETTRRHAQEMLRAGKGQ